MKERRLFHNPWKASERFVDLGVLRWVGSEDRYYELYALVVPGQDHVHFGARYGNEGPAYLSGQAFRKDSGEWAIYGEPVAAIATAAARYFANHYNRGEQDEPHEI